MKLVIFLCIVACCSACTTGSALVTGQQRTPIDPGAVTLYDEAPAGYELVGFVEAASDVRLYSLKAAEERAFVELKKQAAKIGANGVIVWQVGQTTELVPYRDPNTGISTLRVQITKTVEGRAIYIQSEQPN
jgi:hypothetical protein